MKQSTYLDLTAEQRTVLIKAVEDKFHNLNGKYAQMDLMQKTYKDEIRKIDDELKILEATILNTAEGIVSIELIKKTDRIKINTKKAAMELMADMRKAKNQ
jgi:hypothetical protein